MCIRRLHARLAGSLVEPADAREAAIFKLVAMVEGEYTRADHPEVYASLRAIHSGQIKSLIQQRATLPLHPGILLRISIEKGGASVLANGWLVSGHLHRTEAEFFYGFGVLLQLFDDLRDICDDRKAGHWTLFTRAAALHESLDLLTSRLWHFMNRFLDDAVPFRDSPHLELKKLIRRNCTMLMLRAIAETADEYSSEYLEHLEPFSPLSFRFLRRCRRAVTGRFQKIWPALVRQRRFRSVFDLLG